MSNDQAHGVMIASLLLKGGAKLDQQSSDAFTEDYLDAIEDVPAWAVREAIRKWNRAESPKLEDKPHDFNWRPAPPILRQLANHELAGVKARLLVLRDLLTAVPMIEFSDEHCTEMRSRLRGIVKVRPMPQEPHREAGNDHRRPVYGNRGGAMMQRYRRHERFDKTAAADPDLQTKLEAERAIARDFAQDCLDFVEGRQTPGADRAKAEYDRLMKQNKEARRRALCGADPLNLTGVGPAKSARKVLANDPVEHVGAIPRVVPSVNRLHGKNKLDLRQLMAAETYRDAYETVRSMLGGSMDFDRAIGSRFVNRSPTEASLLAAETLSQAKKLLGAQAIIVVESIICDGRTIEECTRRIYDINDNEKPSARDVNYIGRRLRETLSELADKWHPRTRQPRMQNYRPAQGEMVAGDAGVRIMDTKPFVMR